MKRRQFNASATTFGLVAALGLTGRAAHAQAGAPIEGTHYVRLPQKVTTLAPAGKIEVVEFFWYGCPHCRDFEPMLEAWAKKLPPDVVFRRVPVAFRERPFVAHQRIYYALEALGQVEAMHRKVFFAVHSQNEKLDEPKAIAAFMQKNGIDPVKFMEAYDSFGVQTKAKQAAQLGDAYKIDGVPAIGINGQYYTSGSLAGSNEQALRTADHLIQRARKG